LNTEARSQVHQTLLSRRFAIAGSWYKAVAQTSFIPHSATEVRESFVTLAEEVIALLVAEPFDQGRAQAIGAMLAGLHCVQPEALGRTQEVLAQQLVEGLPADQVVDLQFRLAEIHGKLATGFSQRAREIILAEQERICCALTTALLRAAERQV
jgi:hypothetical protein